MYKEIALHSDFFAGYIVCSSIDKVGKGWGMCGGECVCVCVCVCG